MAKKKVLNKKISQKKVTAKKKPKGKPLKKNTSKKKIITKKLSEPQSQKKANSKTLKKKKVSKKRKIFELTWVFESFEHHDTFMTKRMFGGMLAYCHGKMVMMIAEDPGNRDYRGTTYDFDIWNGVLFPTEYEYQDEITKKYPELFQHPVLKKWLYLPLETENFDVLAEDLGNEIRRNNKLFGIFPKIN